MPLSDIDPGKLCSYLWIHQAGAGAGSGQARGGSFFSVVSPFSLPRYFALDVGVSSLVLLVYLQVDPKDVMADFVGLAVKKCCCKGRAITIDLSSRFLFFRVSGRALLQGSVPRSLGYVETRSKLGRQVSSGRAEGECDPHFPSISTLFADLRVLPPFRFPSLIIASKPRFAVSTSTRRE